MENVNWETGNKNTDDKAENKNELTISDIKTHRIGLLVSEKHLSAVRLEDMKGELAQIDEIMETKTVEMRRELGTLPEDFIKTEYALIAKGVNPRLLTIEEANGLYAYSSNATPEVVERKTNSIADAIARIRNGARNRRDYHWDPKKSARLDRLTAKYERFERGEIDMECGFDKSYYIENGDLDGEDYNFDSAREHAVQDGDRSDDYSTSAYTRLIRDMGAGTETERAFEGMETEELLEEGIIDEDDLFVYGPFTRRDLSEDFELFKMSTWVDMVNFRDKQRASEMLGGVSKGSKAGSILDESITSNYDIESDLLREYVAKEILPNRRPTPKNALSMFASLGIEFSKKPKEELISVLTEQGTDDLKDQLSWASYYASKILGMRADELKEEYGSIRPTSEKFFEEVLARSEAMTEQQERWIEKSVAPYLTKFEDRIDKAESLYEDVLLSEGHKDVDFDGLALPGDLFGNSIGQLESKAENGEPEIVDAEAETIDRKPESDKNLGSMAENLVDIEEYKEE